jgi:hypothetical protein
MLMHVTKNLLLILSTILFISCQKEISAELGTTSTGGGGGNGGPTVVHTDSIYLQKYVMAYDPFASYADSFVFIYQYDTFKRVVGGTYNTYQGNTLNSTYTYTYFYNGVDSLPYKYTSLGKDFIYNTGDTTIGFSFYDAAGRMIYDSSINSYTSLTDYYKEKNIDKRQYATANVYYERIRTAIVVPPGTYIDNHYKDTGWLDARKNVIRCSSYDYYNSPTYPPTINYTGIFTYDTKPSPFSYVNVYKTQIEIPGEKSSLVPQRNNYLSDYTENYFFGQPPAPPTVYTSTYTHTFNSIGMVTKTVSSDNIREYFGYRAF